MNIKTIRLENLGKAIAIAGTATDLAERADTSSSYLSQIQNPDHKAKIGDRLARKIEVAINVQEGWMDSKHIDPSKIDTSKKTEEQDRKYLELMHLLDDEQKKEVLELIDLMARKRKILDKYS